MAKSGPKILAIDDTPANLQTLMAVLASDFDLRVAHSGEMGLKVAEREPPDLILLDVMMPDMDGFETCRRLKENPLLKSVPVIFLTAMGESENETTGLLLGAADYITKPFNVAITRHRISNLLEREQLRKNLQVHRDQLEQLVLERSAQLVDRMEQLNTIFSLSPDGFVSFDQGNRVKQVSPSFTRMTGLAEKDVLGLDGDSFTAKLNALCKPKSRYGTALLRNRKADALLPGEPHWATIELAPPQNRVLELAERKSSAKTLSKILYLRDITHEAEVDRMKSNFLEMAAHELRTPMTSVVGFTELLLDMPLDEDTRREMVSTIHQQAELMTSIVNELLDLSEIDAHRGQNFDIEVLTLAEVVEQAAQDYRLPSAAQRASVRLPARALQVSADRNKVQQVVNNLLSNAYKYSPLGSAVQINFLESAMGERRMVGFEVRDSGIGMTVEQQKRCFERFYRADTSGKIPGTGLGMCIVKEIVELHNGHIDIRSTPGAGTTVTVWFRET